MSTFWWTGASGGAFGTAGNFIKDDGTTNTLPADNDTLIFDGRGDGNGVVQSVTSDFAALKQIKLTLLLVLPSYTGNIGDGSNYVELSAAEMLLQGTGICSIQMGEFNGSSYNDTTCTSCVIDTDSGTVNLKSAINSAAKFCTFANMQVNAGLVFLNANSNGEGVDVTNLSVVGGSVEIAPESYHIKTTVSYMNVYQSGGTIISDSPAAIVQITGGSFTLGTNAATPSTNGCPNITMLRLLGGTFVWNAHTTNGTPKITDALFADGEFTTTGKTKKQIGNNANVWSVLRGATVSFDNPNGTTSFGSNCKVRYFGGTIVSPVNTLISW